MRSAAYASIYYIAFFTTMPRPFSVAAPSNPCPAERELSVRGMSCTSQPQAAFVWLAA
eukprot:COSAG06_NODE_1756_length_8453_cov_2.365159_4_plen_58_part_00